MFLIDFEEGRMIPDEEIKRDISTSYPYDVWNKSIVDIDNIQTPKEGDIIEPNLISRMRSFGYTTETMQFMLLPLVTELRDPLGSMGNDAALACLSDKPRLLFDYFKQLFAQVTNPSIDSIREEVVMSLECLIGPEGNLLKNDPKNVRRLRIKNPILSNTELKTIRNITSANWKTKVIDLSYLKKDGLACMKNRIEEVCEE